MKRALIAVATVLGLAAAVEVVRRALAAELPPPNEGMPGLTADSRDILPLAPHLTAPWVTVDVSPYLRAMEETIAELVVTYGLPPWVTASAAALEEIEGPTHAAMYAVEEEPVVWVDPTPMTLAQRADALRKMHDAGAVSDETFERMQMGIRAEMSATWEPGQPDSERNRRYILGIAEPDEPEEV